eukprot:2120579-Rhodomonas_salina.8
MAGAQLIPARQRVERLPVSPSRRRSRSAHRPSAFPEIKYARQPFSAQKAQMVRVLAQHIPTKPGTYLPNRACSAQNRGDGPHGGCVPAVPCHRARHHPPPLPLPPVPLLPRADRVRAHWLLS